MRAPAFPTLIVFACLLTACGQGDRAQDASTGGLGVPSGIYKVDKSHTYVVFSYLHQELSFPLLRMTDIDGQLELDSTAMENSTASIAISVDSVRTNLDYFDKELTSRKFFHAERYPYITFATHSYKPLSETLGELTGFVTIRDITRPLVLSITINGAMEHPVLKKPVIGFSATGSVNRSDFGLDRFTADVGDHVDIRIEAEFLFGSDDESAAAAKLAADAVANADPESLKVIASSATE
jgi:polyisoprenoid-binding protein YceI